ncbi:mannosyltransferase [Mycolicibacterium cosmeticum]|nr:mannosyltransferase [Mycolicibacterium cosmeticum]
MGNQFYAAAAQAGSQDYWEALLFGSLDARNFITVDKPPVSQWVMGLSGQLFGFSSASMLVPEALMAVGSVALLYGAVRRIGGPWAGLLAGAGLALTPVAVLMFRFNNPDAAMVLLMTAGLLAGAGLALTPVAVLMFRFNNPDAAMVLLMTAAAYCAVRALDRNGARWMVLAGVALGFAFLAKMLEGLMVVPAIGLVYLVAAPVVLGRRLLHLLAALVAFVVSAGWYVVLTLVWPASSRPYLAGSTDNNFMNLVLGYNGIARILGRHNTTMFGSMSSQGGDLGGWGGQSQGLTRLFNGEFGFEIGWLLPGALLATALVLVERGRAPRTDRIRAGAMLFGGWMVVDGVVLSLMHGTVHAYYCLSLAPAVAAMYAIGVRRMWVCRDGWFGRSGLTVLLAGTAAWGWWLLHRNPHWQPWIRVAILVLAAAVLALWIGRPAAVRVALMLGVCAALLGPAAYAVATAASAHQGGGPTVGPHRSAKDTGGWGRDADTPALDALLSASHTRWSAAVERSNTAAGLELSTHTAVMAIGGFSGTDPAPTLGQFQQDVARHQIGYYLVEKASGHGPSLNTRAHGDITQWVAAHFPAAVLGSTTVYDLAAPSR